MLPGDLSATRRRFVKAMSAFGALLATPFLPGCKTTAPGSALKDDEELPDDPEAFMAMSIALTGFDELNGAMSPRHLAELKAHHGAKVNQLVAAFKAIDPAAADYEAQVTEKIMSHATHGATAVAAISQWYVGTFSKTVVPEAQAVNSYRNSLIWKVATNGKPSGVPAEEESSWASPLVDG